LLGNKVPARSKKWFKDKGTCIMVLVTSAFVVISVNPVVEWKLNDHVYSMPVREWGKPMQAAALGAPGDRGFLTRAISGLLDFLAANNVA
jgi:hypothetical protein